MKDKAHDDDVMADFWANIAKAWNASISDAKVKFRTPVISDPKELDNVEQLYSLDGGCAAAPPELGVPYVEKSCGHRWKTYIGLHEKFEYCEWCDEKKK